MRFHRHALRSMTAALLLVLMLSFAASAQDATPEATEAAPEEAPEEAPASDNYLLDILFDGETVDAAFEGDVSAHLYAFNALAGDVVTVTMTREEGNALDPYLVVLGAFGQLIARDDDGAGDLNAQITDLEIAEDGLYFIIASSYVGIDDINDENEAAEEALVYSLSVSGTTATEEQAATFQYFSQPLELGDSLLGYSTTEEPVFYFSYIAEAETAIDISVASEDFDTLLMVFAPGGDRILINDDADDTGTNSAATGLELAEAGKYLIFVTDIGFTNIGDEEANLSYVGGDFEISINAAQ